uniref:Putative RNA-directed RNA polymerase n=1 Tax=Moniliophthora roreri TaxID=221103 RepID=A0A0W0GCD2_MONRR
MPPEYTLRPNLTINDTSWSFTVPQTYLSSPTPNFGKCIRFTQPKLVLQIQKFPYNRILHEDNPTKFVLCSFGDLRFPETPLRTTGEYIGRVLKEGVWLNGVQYRFYGHSNSQLRSRSCFLREAKSDEELDRRLYVLGDFEKIMNVAKRAKRIGLLFSEAQVDYQLDPQYIIDIPDIKVGDELFSDGCGLVSKRLAVMVSKQKRIIFRGVRYTPCVYQIRYLGYKGVLMLHPAMDKNKNHPHLAEFRKSMKKFSTTRNHTFSVVDYSKPYAFGRLNNDIIVLLSSLGITNEKLLGKQRQYHDWITEASVDPIKAFMFLSASEDHELAERVLLDGLDDPHIINAIRRKQAKEVASFKGERTHKDRTRMIIQKSRLLFGVCDPFRVLKEGEAHIRITTGRSGPSTPIHGDVLVVRNPCLHPGDCLKLRAASYNELSHLTDCIVFASVAKPGRHSAPSMSSGGDLDGDKYFVCWDPDLVPSTVAESYDYPPNKERPSKSVSRADLANHFAAYNNSGLARVAALHAKWVRGSPKGALSTECQELNALHSQAVDGASVKIPERLASPPEPPGDFILDLLAKEATEFAENFTRSIEQRSAITSIQGGGDDDITREDHERILLRLLSSQHNTISEYELFTLAWRFCQKFSLPLAPYMAHFDLGAFTAQQKYAILSTMGLDLDKERYPHFWNSLFRSDLLSERDLYQRCLDRPFSIQRLYSSKIHGLATFFEYLRMAMQEYTRKVLVLKTDDRLAVGIFIRGEIPWDEDPIVKDNVVVCSFLPQTTSTLSTYRPCTADYRLHCSDVNLQLYDKLRLNTFIFLTIPPRASGAEVIASIALQKFSTRVQQQLGRLNRQPVTGIEIHVVSNRDRVSHQLFDLWFEHVPTEQRVKRFEREVAPYSLNEIKDVEWDEHPPWMQTMFYPKQDQDVVTRLLEGRTPDEVDKCMELALAYHAEDELFWIYSVILAQEPIRREQVIKWMDLHPPLAFMLLKKYPPDEAGSLPAESRPFCRNILHNIIRSSNQLGIACLVAFEKMTGTITQLSVEDYFSLLWLSALTIRSLQLLQETLLVLNDCRASQTDPPHSPALQYGHRHALGIAMDRAEEAADECPCDADGKPRKQRTPPSQTRLKRVEDNPFQVVATLRVDSRTPIRLHSHVRLQAASKPDNRWVPSIVLDGIVIQSMKGELKIELLHPPPPEMEVMDWNMYHAGSTATSRAMLDALARLLKDKSECCGFYSIITGHEEESAAPVEMFRPLLGQEEHLENLNGSQEMAVRSCSVPLSLIWGPPGTGKTTVIVQILCALVKTKSEDSRILMTASTHNAVDNVLERFISINKTQNILREEQILRVATDLSKVNKDLQSFTIDARVGGDMNENNKLFKKAQERLNAAVIVFTTCAGAGLGILRKADFDMALIDEASQINEPCALIPLVKGVQRAILVGDQPTVKKIGKVLEFDVSLLERLYTGPDQVGLSKAMLDIQYRFPQELAAFPSREFYEGRLHSGIQDSNAVLGVLRQTRFPWPVDDNQVIVPTIFIQCSAEEDMGGRSKSNTGQVDLIVDRIMPLLTTPNEGTTPADLKITVLSPYNKQITELRSRLPSIATASTIDAFQGRESDIIIFSSVRCNAEADIGFVDDARRLNVMWTRARLAMIIVGDRRTLEANAMWKRAVGACREVKLDEIASAGGG